MCLQAIAFPWLQPLLAAQQAASAAAAGLGCCLHCLVEQAPVRCGSKSSKMKQRNQALSAVFPNQQFSSMQLFICHAAG
jgi:hypothetical protein